MTDFLCQSPSFINVQPRCDNNSTMPGFADERQVAGPTRLIEKYPDKVYKPSKGLFR